MKIKDIVKMALREDDNSSDAIDNDPTVKAAQGSVDKAQQALAIAQQALATARANASKKLTAGQAGGSGGSQQGTGAQTVSSASPLSGN